VAISKNLITSRRLFWLKVLIHIAALLPVTWLYYNAITGTLDSDPVKTVIHFTGIGILNLLLITLLVTPLSRLTHENLLARTRRLLGLYGFFYAFLHFGSFVAFDLQFHWNLIVAEIIDRPYITVGFTAFLILLSLAVTSPNLVRRKVGRQWRRLHQGIYIAVLLGCLHYIWSVKSDIFPPLLYFFMAFILLGYRYFNRLSKKQRQGAATSSSSVQKASS